MSYHIRRKDRLQRENMFRHEGTIHYETQEFFMSAGHHLPSATDLQRELEQVRRDYAIALKDRPEHARALEERARKLEAELARQK